MSMRMITILTEGPLGIFDEDIVTLDVKEGVLAGKMHLMVAEAG